MAPRRDSMTQDDSTTETDDLRAEAEAMALWEHHLQDAAASWREGVSGSADDYREGLAEAMGVEPEDVPDEAVENWQESVMETDAREFARSVAGQGTDWFTGLYESATGEEPPPEVEELAAEIEREALAAVDDDASDEAIIDAVEDAVGRRRAEASDGG